MIFIRQIDVSQISEVIKRLCIEANYDLGEDVKFALEKTLSIETSPMGVEIINQLRENASIASSLEIPMCQDTGFAVVFLEIGQEVIFTGGSLEEAVDTGVRDGYREGFLRKSMVGDPLNRVNTNDNTPAILHIKIVTGKQVKVTVAPKGGGSENMSTLKMLKPSEGIEGVKQFVIETVRKAGPNPCPPIIVGVGIGGTMEKAAMMSKYALTRNIGQVSSDHDTAELEKQLCTSINLLGIGPQGMGGNTTALAVHVEKFATHIACLPVAVNISCHAYRHKTALI